ncbi:hypothetical protein IMG5_007270 [Ichthyophthirius multifiliis]|uniref:ACB domain-containing protein n=1 Tax=Ichthyophthirius multifiliis TaxID=5932 RepID=G0QJN8_ICHMU|nr:hypothetical protein IMG5_007270 [Ichthyophthirius multifiliis]EGR34567.1 hypothetical protein IMG5_007270 [Ichthyophthirius multifiliis]|eukprot:XP_004039871.1 hypothetical protein IMG5_007270 [Ichthyophthirius multifiliis]
MTIEEKFNKALNFIKEPPKGHPPVELTNQQKLTFYALFQQAKQGQCKGSQPSRLKIIERAKYDAWKALGNLSKEDSMNKYITELTKIAPNWDLPQPKL